MNMNSLFINGYNNSIRNRTFWVTSLRDARNKGWDIALLPSIVSLRDTADSWYSLNELHHQ